VLVGPSGCGKSTTLRMIAGLEEISGGTVSIDGRIVNHVLPKDRDIAMVFQNYALYPHMTVYDNMAFGLKLRKFDRAEIDRRVREAAEMLGLESLLERKPKALSGGQRQRVAVGRAIVRKPKVFLFDEPLSNLDAKMRVSTRTEIAKLHARLGATMIYVTHDQVEAMTMGDRICVMKDGRIMQVDEPLALYHVPQNVFTAGFIGSPPMNFIRGTIVRAEGRLHFREQNERSSGFSFLLDARLAGQVQDRGGQPVVCGFRPEDIHDELPETPDDSRPVVAATVDVVEPMGSESLLYVRTGDHHVIARVRPTARYDTGQSIRLALDLNKAQLFDAKTGVSFAGAGQIPAVTTALTQ
jgi:multiple sugar transport system ATP-binding protein